MRVLQCIDSLNPGGAERMAVNIANNLVGKVEYSALCVTRKEGLLLNDISQEVEYFFLNKKSYYDILAIKKLLNFIRLKRINIVHAHGTSFFMGTIQKFLTPNLKLIWHDHLGNRINKGKVNFPMLSVCSFKFDGIISVSSNLLEWNKNNLKAKTNTYIPNFVDNSKIDNKSEVEVKNDKNKIVLVCVANFRVPKNHLNLLKAFKIISGEITSVKLFLVGKDYQDQYSENLKRFITINNLEKKVFLINGTSAVFPWLYKSDIGIISSDVEGLPMALLEYGVAKLPVVSTNVGECPEIIKTTGKIVEPNNPRALADAVLFYIKNESVRRLDAEKFNQVVINEFSEEKVIGRIRHFYSSI